MTNDNIQGELDEKGNVAKVAERYGSKIYIYVQCIVMVCKRIYRCHDYYYYNNDYDLLNMFWAQGCSRTVIK